MATREIILVLSGEIATGKTSLASKLFEKYNFTVVKSRELLEQRLIAEGKSTNRTDLQKIGEKLDKETEGDWVVQEFQKIYKEKTEKKNQNLFVFDAARIQDQIRAFRRSYQFSVIHIHLKASKEVLKERHYKRLEHEGFKAAEKEGEYKKIKSNRTEQGVNLLEDRADLVINTGFSTEEDVVVRAVSFLKLQTPLDEPLVDVIIGGQFGSEGKGQISGYLATNYDCLIRVGGPNAGHYVYEREGAHLFHTLPSGTNRNQEAHLVIGPGAVISPEVLLDEIQEYQIDDPSRLTIDENAVIIEEKDKKFEDELKENIGSTGQGVGAATSKNIINRLHDYDLHKAKHCKELKPYIGSTYNVIQYFLSQGKKILLEGAQGTMLSLYHGFYPKVTSRDTTVSGCLAEAGIPPRRVRRIIMVVRSYPIRVGGKSGDFKSKEIDWDTIVSRSGLEEEKIKGTEKGSTTGKERRVGEFSWSLFRKACDLNSPTDIAFTFADYISSENEDAIRFEQLTLETRKMIEELERCSGVRVSLIGTGFDYRAILDRRNWR